jgi:hydrogenase maturation factor HypF (carbamoyltransferase family)
MSKQLITRVDDDLKILGDAIMLARGETMQTVLHQAYFDYILSHAGTEDLLQSVYSYVVERQKADLAPLVEKMSELRNAQAVEEMKQKELLDKYTEVCGDAKGKKLLEVVSRRLHYENPRVAVIDVMIDNQYLFQKFFSITPDDDENKLIDTALTMARIYSSKK